MEKNRLKSFRELIGCGIPALPNHHGTLLQDGNGKNRIGGIIMGNRKHHEGKHFPIGKLVDHPRVYRREMLKNLINSLGKFINLSRSILSHHDDVILKNIGLGGEDDGLGRIVGGKSEDREGNRLIREFMKIAGQKMVGSCNQPEIVFFKAPLFRQIGEVLCCRCCRWEISGIAKGFQKRGRLFR